MGSYIEINDTLQITKEQGFPVELNWKQHLKNPYTAEQFKDKVFEFKNKSNIRNWKLKVCNFTLQNQIKYCKIKNNIGNYLFY